MTVFDTCDSLIENGIWASLYNAGGGVVEVPLSIDSANKIEGSASVKAVLGAGLTWDYYVYKRKNATASAYWDLSRDPLITFRIYRPAGQTISIDFEIIIRDPDGSGWNRHTYGALILEDGWNTKVLDLRTALEGLVSEDALKMVAQLSFVAHSNRQAFTMNIDYIEIASGVSLPLSIEVRPSTVTLNQYQTQEFSALVLNGFPPYTVTWYLNDSSVGTGNTYNFGANTLGTFKLYAIAKDSENTEVRSNEVTMIVLEKTEATPLHIEGNKVKNSKGETILLKGVNHVGFSDTCVGWFPTIGTSDNYYTWNEAAVRSHLQAMRNWGINILRCHFWASWWIKNSSDTLGGGATSINFRTALKNLINLAREYGIYIVIDIWSITPPSRVEYPFDGISEADFKNLWLSISSELELYPNVLYEFYNEPAGADAPRWFTACQDIITAIRARGDEHIIVIQWLYAGSFDWLRTHTLTGTNILYSMHIYRHHGTFDDNPASPTDYDYIKETLLTRRDYQYPINNKMPIWIGEIGAFNGATDDAEFEAFKNELKLFKEWQIGYAYFLWYRGMQWDLQKGGTVEPTRVGDELIADMKGTPTDGEPTPPPTGGCLLFEATKGTVFMTYLPSFRRFRDKCLSRQIQWVYYKLSKFLVRIIKKLRRMR